MDLKIGCCFSWIHFDASNDSEDIEHVIADTPVSVELIWSGKNPNSNEQSNTNVEI